MITSEVPVYVRLILIVGKSDPNPLERMAVQPWIISEFGGGPHESDKELPTNTFTNEEYELFATGADIVTTDRGRYNKVRDEAKMITQWAIDTSKAAGFLRDYSTRCNERTPLRSLEYQLLGLR
ncbi:MAG TPA: hypothetical protein VJH20_04715 [Candidatus Nanoarchaeia archaeon]|nr:hypothetical protein [Candidatus Nanoarchaeia archaeon]